MKEQGGTDRSTAAEFAIARRDWMRTRVTELSEAFADHPCRLHALTPADLGDIRLVNALVFSRIAADEARVQPVADTVAWLELLIPNGHRYDLSTAVREVRSGLTLADDPALWSWNAEAWEESLLGVWRQERTRTVESWRADDELVSRWGVRTPTSADASHPELAPQKHGHSLTGLNEYLASEEEPLGLLAQAVLSQPHVVDSVEDSLALSEESLQNAGHLAFLAEQQICARALIEWCDSCGSATSAATEAFLEQLSKVVEAYLSDVVGPVLAALPKCERRLFTAGTSAEQRDRNEYLTEFLDCVDIPSARAWTDGVLDKQIAQEAVDHWSQDELTWHSMRGSVPVWYHIVTSPQERAAALAFSGAASSSSAIRVHTDAEVFHQPDLFSGLDESDASDDWYPEPGVELHYSRNSATDLCELLALAQLGRARLEFLVLNAGGDFVLLRSLGVSVLPADTDAWAPGALRRLRALVPNLDDLADVIAGEDEESCPDGVDDEDSLDDHDVTSEEEGTAGRRKEEPAGTQRTHGSGGPEAPQPSPPAQLPPQLMARVKAILRQAEDPSVTEAESEAFLQKATALMAKYGIEQAMLSGDEPTSEQPVDRVVEATAPWMRECKRLLAQIALQMRCQAVYPGGKSNRHRVHLFGFASDLHSVEVLYASLRLQMLQGSELAGAEHRPAGEDPRAYKRSWMLGFIRAVVARVGEAERAAREESENEQRQASPDGDEVRSVALVLADRTAEVEAEVSARYPKLGKARRTRFKGSGYRQGHADGQQADIGGLSLEDEDEEDHSLAG
ncbi:Protein of unknown function [Streptomyces sp. WMMB 714]|uniref:DUF2786 domain-containing protein n=1 Tax=Streptomyces sp. WMMB 714 TaxID=1286822 RepID=UPI000697BB8B|nr:DUF2786 domain-containing protein [Streptomyces sp. WMMB 714]SCK47853.1 Protein of unknown function [Streptomyces sp. WMMB 714]